MVYQRNQMYYYPQDSEHLYTLKLSWSNPNVQTSSQYRLHRITISFHHQITHFKLQRLLWYIIMGVSRYNFTLRSSHGYSQYYPLDSHWITVFAGCQVPVFVFVGWSLTIHSLKSHDPSTNVIFFETTLVLLLCKHTLKQKISCNTINQQFLLVKLGHIRCDLSP